MQLGSAGLVALKAEPSCLPLIWFSESARINRHVPPYQRQFLFSLKNTVLLTGLLPRYDQLLTSPWKCAYSSVCVCFSLQNYNGASLGALKFISGVFNEYCRHYCLQVFWVFVCLYRVFLTSQLWVVKSVEAVCWWSEPVS